MAASNGYGLLLCTLMLGYGFVDFPRSIWYFASNQSRLRKIELEITKIKEEAIDAESDIFEVTRDLAVILTMVDKHHLSRPFVDVILKKLPSAADVRGQYEEGGRVPKIITNEYLVKFHAKLIDAIRINDRNQAYFKIT